MDKTTITLSALLAASALGNLYLLKDGAYKQTEVKQDVPTQELLAKADPACAAEVAQVGPAPQCSQDGASQLGIDTKLTTGLWQCNGAIMPKRVQDCLTAALAKMPVAMQAEAAIK